jgi:hypothetical protein
MEKVGSFFYGVGAFVIGGLIMVGGWWISMLNVSLDKMAPSPNFTSGWTLFGLAMIFIGAYLPFMIVGLRSRFVHKRRELNDLNRQVAADHAASSAPPAAPTEAPPSILPGDPNTPTER